MAVAKLQRLFRGPRRISRQTRSARPLPKSISKESGIGSSSSGPDADNPSDWDTFKVVDSFVPKDSSSLLVHSSDFQSDVPVLINNRFPTTTQYDDKERLVHGQVGMSVAQRQLMNLSATDDTVTVFLLNLPIQETYLTSIDLEVAFLQHDTLRTYFADEMAEHFTHTLMRRRLGRDHQLLFEFDSVPLKATVKDLVLRPNLPELAKASQSTLVDPAFEIGTVAANTKVTFNKAPNSHIVIERTRSRASNYPSLPFMNDQATSSSSSSEQAGRRRSFIFHTSPRKQHDPLVSDQVKATYRTNSLSGADKGNLVKGGTHSTLGHCPSKSYTLNGPLNDIPIQVDTSDLATALAKWLDLAVPIGSDFPNKDSEATKDAHAVLVDAAAKKISAEKTAGDLILPADTHNAPIKGTKQALSVTILETTSKTAANTSATVDKPTTSTEKQVTEPKPEPTIEITGGGILEETIQLRDGNILTTIESTPVVLTDNAEVDRNQATPGSTTPTEQSRHQSHPIQALISNPESLGIGGLDNEFRTLFNRALASRLYPPELISSLGIQHMKGIIIYGPPGTGKTLMARSIAKCLNAKEKLVNGPDIFDKFIGESEKKLRELFSDAENDYKEQGSHSKLHVIILDELDAIGKRRGNEAGGSGRVGDNIVNQLLSKMDGVEQLHNVLLIGMTNRLDMIDEALLRPGRFEVHLKLGIPDVDGRRRILNTHVSKMRDNFHLDGDVKLARLADETSSFSGADIAGLVRSATNIALGRWLESQRSQEEFRVTMRDFRDALVQIRPAQNSLLEDLEQAVPHGIIPFDHPGNIIKTLLHKGEISAKQASSGGTRPISVLLHGPSETGKTALAVTIAKASTFPFVRLVSPDNIVGFTRPQQVVAINKVFSDSRKYQFSAIVVDDVEQLLGWDPINQRYSVAVLQALSVLFRRPPPKGHGLLIITTSSNRSILAKLQLLKLFDIQLLVPPISTPDAMCTVLRHVKLFSTTDKLKFAMDKIQKRVSYEQHSTEVPVIGIKRLLRIICMVKYESNWEEVVKRLVEELDNIQII